MISKLKGTPPRFFYDKTKIGCHPKSEIWRKQLSSRPQKNRTVGQGGYYLAELWHRAKNDTKTIKMINENGLWRVSQFVIKMNQRKKATIKF